MLFIRKVVNNLKVFAILFVLFAFLIVTAARMFSTGSFDFAGNGENIEEKVDAFTNSLGNSWDTALPGKNKLTAGVGLMQYYLTGEISSVQVLQGKDRWLFYKATNDGDPIADYTGTNSFSEQEKMIIKDTVLRSQEVFQEKGIECCFLIPPNKENVYSRFMPENYEKTEITRTDELIAYLQKADIPVFNPKEELIKYSENYDVFYRYDTHWNELGAYIATRQILETWGIRIDKATEENIISGDNVKNDLAEMVGLDMIFDDDPGQTVTSLYDVDWNVFTAQQNTTFSQYHNANAQLDKTLLLVGDSFREAMLPTLCTVFENVYVIHRSCYTKELIDQCKPDYAIFEYVERYSNQMAIPIT